MAWKISAACALGIAVTAGLAALAQEAKKEAPPKPRVFEMRTYVAHPGKMEALHARFRDYALRLFAKHGMEMVGFWTPTEGADADRTLVYILAYPSREAREASWAAFKADPEWVKAKAESEKDGALVQKSTAVFMNPTDYSPTR